MMQNDLFSEVDTGTITGTDLRLQDAIVRYYPDFVENHDIVYRQLLSELCWQQDTIDMYGKSVLIPRLNAWHGDANARYGYSGIALQPAAWTPLLSSLKKSLENFLECRFNSVLANYYRHENDSVAWHSDDERELGFQPVIASLSFGQTRRFSLKHKFDRAIKIAHVDLQGGSLLFMGGDTQSHWRHQVAKMTAPCEGRINLTFRHVVPGNR